MHATASWPLPVLTYIVMLSSLLSSVRPTSKFTTSISNSRQSKIMFGLQSLFAATGLGAILVTISTKNIAEEIVGGFAIQLHGHVVVGDEVKLGDGTAGIIQRLGWSTTEVRGYDDLVMHIPNSALIHQQVTNISRTKRSQLKQELRFKYSDLKKIPGILKEIKKETAEQCPKLITDGSAVYRSLITDYENDHIRAEVNFHFEIQPGSDEEAENRQQALLAIARVVEKNGVKFALPSVSYQRNNY